MPAFGALIAEPLFLLADSAIIGHLGTAELAGVGIASTLVQTVVGLMVFLAYSTTPAVARHLGAGRLADALRVGRDGLWTAAGLGVVLAAVGAVVMRPLLRAMGAQGEVLDHATSYALWSLPGLVAMLIVLAAVGVLRGLQDTTTPLLVAGVGAAVNAGLNFALVYGAHLGVAGAAIGFYDGALGPGTGSFLVFALVGLLGYDFLQASAKAKIVNLATNIGAIAVFAAALIGRRKIAKGEPVSTGAAARPRSRRTTLRRGHCRPAPCPRCRRCAGPHARGRSAPSSGR